MEDKLFAEKLGETKSQVSRKGHWLFCVRKNARAHAHEYVCLTEIHVIPSATVHDVGAITSCSLFRHFCGI